MKTWYSQTDTLLESLLFQFVHHNLEGYYLYDTNRHIIGQLKLFCIPMLRTGKLSKGMYRPAFSSKFVVNNTKKMDYLFLIL